LARNLRGLRADDRCGCRAGNSERNANSHRKAGICPDDAQRDGGGNRPAVRHSPGGKRLWFLHAGLYRAGSQQDRKDNGAFSRLSVGMGAGLRRRQRPDPLGHDGRSPQSAGPDAAGRKQLGLGASLRADDLSFPSPQDQGDRRARRVYGFFPPEGQRYSPIKPRRGGLLPEDPREHDHPSARLGHRRDNVRPVGADGQIIGPCSGGCAAVQLFKNHRGR